MNYGSISDTFPGTTDRKSGAVRFFRKPGRIARTSFTPGKHLLMKEQASTHRNIVHFFFELGMLKKTPRTGFQFLGSGGESVADHSFRTAVIGYTLARLSPGVDPHKVVCMCLFHDIPEARTGDLNYVNKQYVSSGEREAVSDLSRRLPFGDEYRALLDEYRSESSREALLVHDADQLDLILSLKEQHDLGNFYARKWIRFALKRLKTDLAESLAAEILETDSSDWWFKGHDHWWHKSQED